ncbi:hypothetical protein [Mycobacterium sp.]|uniref:hypothetical protein n=1 Tax=Mycobacterium sp. TaxID=1785 RepID=UPI0025D0AEFE|nr:hypothetical protein [Mycobacterium sp.]
MARARVLIAAGAVLIVLSLFVNVPLHGAVGLAATAVASMALLIAGVAAAANGAVQLRRYKGH